MEDDYAISVQHISKVYRIWNSPGDRLKVPALQRIVKFARPVSPTHAEAVDRYTRSRYREFAALTDISFDVKKGEALGIIGLNGSGKSTLLQIIAGTLAPSSGKVHVRGKVAALLELGSGFNPEFSGRENVYLNGAVLGMSRRQMDERFDDIAAFADIGSFIDQPVKVYSTGMLVRLAFAVQVHLEPDVLIVDEALAVGDASFQAKAMNRIDKVLGCGTTLLFVGHDLTAVKAFCTSAKLLRAGKIASAGSPEDVVTDYMYDVRASEFKASFSQNMPFIRLDNGFRAERVEVIEASLNEGARHGAILFGQTLELTIRLLIGIPMECPHVLLDIRDGRSLLLTGKRIPVPPTLLGKAVTLRVAITALFQRGIYRIGLRIASVSKLEISNVVFRQGDLLSFEILDDSHEKFSGLFPVPLEVTWNDSEAVRG